MFPLVFVIPALGLIVGAALGGALRRRGWRTDRPVGGSAARRIGAGLAALAALLALLSVRGADLAAALPVTFELALQHTLPELTRFLVAGALGVVIGLEWPVRREAARLRRLALPVVVIGMALAFFVHRGRPIAGTLGPTVLDGTVVMQTTPFTCAPAAIATALRVTGIAPDADERRMAAAAGTTREGTSTIGELRALRAAGAAPTFGRRLTADSLRRRAQIAVLHVNEPVGTTTIRHAVALIGYERATDTFVVANPLAGLQRLRADALEGYWIGEAVFLSGSRWSEPAAAR